MSKALSRTLYLLSILAWIIGGLLLARGLMGSTILPNGTISHIAHPGSVRIGLIVLIAGGVLAFIAWIGALIRTAQLGRWGWFVCLLLFSGIAMLVYIFIGPKYPARPPMPVTTPPYGGYGY